MTTCEVLTDAILEGSNEWVELFRSHDFRRLSELYTPDCRVFPPGSPVANGRSECARIMEGMYRSGVDRISLHNLQNITAGGELAAEHGRYICYDNSGKETNRGKYMCLWKNVEGKWLIHYDILNSDEAKIKDKTAQVVLSSDQWEHYFRTGNFVALSRLYSEDCKVFPPNMAVAIGRDACKNAWAGLASMGVSRIDIDNVATTDMSENLASDRSSYMMYDLDGKKIDHGKYIVLWKKTKGRWELHYDIFNSDVMHY